MQARKREEREESIYFSRIFAATSSFFFLPRGSAAVERFFFFQGWPHASCEFVFGLVCIPRIAIWLIYTLSRPRANHWISFDVFSSCLLLLLLHFVFFFFFPLSPRIKLRNDDDLIFCSDRLPFGVKVYARALDCGISFSY